jgi:hypothetical protein
LWSGWRFARLPLLVAPIALLLALEYQRLFDGSEQLPRNGSGNPIAIIE